MGTWAKYVQPHLAQPCMSGKVQIWLLVCTGKPSIESTKKNSHGALHRSEVYQCGLIRLCHNIDVQAVMGLEVEYGTSKVTSRGYRVLGYCSGCT